MEKEAEVLLQGRDVAAELTASTLWQALRGLYFDNHAPLH